MHASYPETENTVACITLYLAFCVFVYGLFGYSFYEMFQPRHIATVGLAAYKPPVASARLLGDHWNPTATLKMYRVAGYRSHCDWLHLARCKACGFLPPA
jgi:hypothetical protein